MSARFFKILSGVILFHVIMLSAVWVGFSAPLPRPPANFVYVGALSQEDAGSIAREVWPNGQNVSQVPFDHQEDANFNHWIELRGLAKPH